MFIAMGVYTGSLNKYSQDTGSAISWPNSWGLGWAGASFEVFAGFLYLVFYCLVGCESKDGSDDGVINPELMGSTKSPNLMKMAHDEVECVRRETKIRNKKVAEDYQLDP